MFCNSGGLVMKPPGAERAPAPIFSQCNLLSPVSHYGMARTTGSGGLVLIRDEGGEVGKDGKVSQSNKNLASV